MTGRGGGWYWTPGRIRAAIVVFAEDYGHPPTYEDWSPKRTDTERYERYHHDNCWPTGATVTRHFGSWNAAIAAAGFEPIKPGTQPNPDRFKTRCAKGHEFTPENTAFRKSNGQRICITCRDNARRESYRKNHAGPGSRASRGMPPSDHPKWKEKA